MYTDILQAPNRKAQIATAMNMQGATGRKSEDMDRLYRSDPQAWFKWFKDVTREEWSAKVAG